MFDLPALDAKRDVLYAYVDAERQMMDWEHLQEMIQPWSHGERGLVRLAHSLYNEEERVWIDELQVLSPKTRHAVLTIIERFYAS